MLGFGKWALGAVADGLASGMGVGIGRRRQKSPGYHFCSKTFERLFGRQEI
jgi:hypothetical protein